MRKQITVAILISVGLSFMASAETAKRSAASKTDPIKGLNCVIEYKAVGSLRFHSSSDTSGNWILGDESKATLKDRMKGPKVTIEALEKNKKDYFRIKIASDKGELLNSVSEWTSLQVTLPVQVTEPTSEDPRTFDQMRITCESASIAG